MSISICIPTYNRTHLLFESFAKVYDDPRISEIVIVDDCSVDTVWYELAMKCKDLSKVKLYRNEKNLDCYRNKREAVSKASNEWVILLDSDNVIDVYYLDAIDSFSRYRTFILQPSFAKPHFDFRAFEYKTFSRSDVGEFMHINNFQTMLNACNFFVNRDEYLNVWDGSVDPVTSDSIYFALKWIERGNSFLVVPNMHYEHRVHDGSHYKNNNKRTPRGFHEEVIQRLKAMR